ncbi:unnamed protein product [Moneuplotes crassus]|uniref:Uncharacterized protein n=1 Tax=Euplotes crassus TaxID=5936 RepID=A0AAD2D899_EUPCR|nr:unnamed protein product [Moneuplotes crassus]CAI2385521.1 unnamed protein product [Moneuplotes crassus]|eukprot:CAMPEP_0197003724 /NCGR_PEP_ID=MMETSP1380-20130617/11992_1 /TAXON_ID=5936 /ORGANISM="Euplotes crassus, Strain CT5" /LENGTH=72 /DNA_ID=CAMNT_0042422305 /DNA_START=14 /DNA_END=232 /DNA_ORIENTATION=+
MGKIAAYNRPKKNVKKEKTMKKRNIKRSRGEVQKKTISAREHMKNVREQKKLKRMLKRQQRKEERKNEMKVD